MTDVDRGDRRRGAGEDRLATGGMGRARRDRVLDETFDALMFDWVGAAVPDQGADATAVRVRIERLCALGVHCFVLADGDVRDVDRQLRARPTGDGYLFLCCNHGSEVFEVTVAGPRLVDRRTAEPDEQRALGEAADAAAATLRCRGLEVSVRSDRRNRRTIELLVDPSAADRPRSDRAPLEQALAERLARAGIADLAEIVTLVVEHAAAAGLGDLRVTCDVTQVEVGLADRGHAARFAGRWLAERGITGPLVLVVGDELGSVSGVTGNGALMAVEELAGAVAVSVGTAPGVLPPGVLHLGGGPDRFSELLDRQLARRSDRRAPQLDPDPAWTLALPTSTAQGRVAESLGSLANGSTGVRGAREEDGSGTTPLLVVNGLFDDEGHLLAGPTWAGLELAGARPDDRRLLDLRTGTLWRFGVGDPHLRTVRFVSAASPHIMGLRAEASPGCIASDDPLEAPRGHGPWKFEHHATPGFSLAGTSSTHSSLALAARDVGSAPPGRRTIERLAAWASRGSSRPPFEAARQRLLDADELGFDRLLADHRREWAARWADADVVIEGSGEEVRHDQLAARFSIFHLLGCAAATGEAVVGPRGLTGDAYGGHVFWDAEIFVLPVLAAVRPAAARAMLEYRIRCLPAARGIAAQSGLQGARFPWESAADGTDVTPRVVPGRHGDPIPVVTGQYEEHIVADVAWAADRYATLTGDASFLAGEGRDLVIETARYWASRVRVDAGGRAHLDAVMGPDEYHEVVDDNAFTNVMARWNLRRGAGLLLASAAGTTTEAAAADEAAWWLQLADQLVDGWNPALGLYEQFAGYFDLEPLHITDLAQPPVAADVVLGRERLTRSQVIKQADVLMLHHLVPGEVHAGSLGPCLDFYEPRTAHGSSLSPAIHASLLARAGQPDRALDLFRLAARLDLDDVTGTTAGGLHLAAMGGLWQALAHGFLGLSAADGILTVDPRLPAAWTALGLRMRFGGRRVGLRAEHDAISVTCDGPLPLRLGAGEPSVCPPPGARYRYEEDTNS